MGGLARISAVAVAGAALYFAGLLNSIILAEPERPGAAVVVIAIAAAIAVQVLALSGHDREFGPTTSGRVRVFRGVWVFVSVMALVGLSWFVGMPRKHSYDWTPYHNDAIALNECAARLLLSGRNPYTDLDLFACYRELGIGPDRTTPLRRGLFSNDAIYPSDDELDAVWDLRARGVGANEEFVWRPSYPALSFLALVPFVAVGIDPNYVYVACLLAAMALILVRARAAARPLFLTGLLGAASLSAFTVGGSSDLLYALPLVAALLWRGRSWAGIPLGLAIAAKQIAWFFMPFYLIALIGECGRRRAVRDLAIASGVFGLVNLPFVMADAGAWIAGVLTPLVEPMFPRGAGLVFLSTSGLLPLLPSLAYAAFEVVAGAVCLGLAWRTRRTSPEIGAALAVVPLFFAWRSLFSYFFLLPLFAFAGLARMPLGDLAPERASRAGALTIFAAPGRAAGS